MSVICRASSSGSRSARLIFFKDLGRMGTGAFWLKSINRVDCLRFFF